jgi:hypothetical protein
VVVVNLSGACSQARVRFPWPDLAGRRLSLVDALADETFERDGGETVDPGLYVDLPPWGFHLLAVENGASSARREAGRDPAPR